MSDNDLFPFAEEGDAGHLSLSRNPWRVLIIDDEQEVHDVTKLALRDFEFQGRELEFLHAHSAAEAKELLVNNDHIALALVDVVMETDHAGLDLVRWIREEHQDLLIRLVLRTGQPGQAPERRVIVDFDINDYKEKTDLTATKLFTLMVASLRNYQSLHALDRARRGLLYMVESSRELATRQSLNGFIEGVLLQLQGVLAGAESTFYSRCLGVLGPEGCVEPREQIIIAGTGEFANCSQQSLAAVSDATIQAEVHKTLKARASRYLDDGCVAFFESKHGNHGVLYVGGLSRALDETERGLVETFCMNTATAFDNLHLHREIEATQKEVVLMLGRVAEFHSPETGAHIERMARLGAELARLAGVDEAEVDLLASAMPMHDVGKIVIPDDLLHKPGKLDEDEWEIMKTHAQLGYDMLSYSRRPILQAAAIIAHEHHEWWDGSGYPRGLAGEDIHLYGRIAALADVFDALGSKRCYKEPWPNDQIEAYILDMRNLQFDPRLTDLLLENIDRFHAIREELPD